jgi:hypothetical protein
LGAVRRLMIFASEGHFKIEFTGNKRRYCARNHANHRM